MSNGFFNSTVEVQQSSTSRTGRAGTREVFSTRIASLSCMLSRKQLEEADLHGKQTVIGKWRLFCAADTDGLSIEETDRIIWGDKTLQVKTIYNPSEADDHLEIDCLELT